MIVLRKIVMLFFATLLIACTGSLSNGDVFDSGENIDAQGSDRGDDSSLVDSDSYGLIDGDTSNQDIVIDVDVPALLHEVELHTDSAGCNYELHTVTIPLADFLLDVAVVGSSQAKRVSQYASDYQHKNPFALINGGYFGSSGPVSYAKGHLGYESPSGNVKGPRACLAYDRYSRVARIEQSYGRQLIGSAWGNGLFPQDSDVLCAGPQLVKNNINVFSTQYYAENFEDSGINPNTRNPRSALCILGDGTLLMLMAQSPTKKECGLTLPKLADLMVAKGCIDGMNLDGGGSSALWAAGPPVVYQEGTEDRAVFNVMMVYLP